MDSTTGEVTLQNYARPDRGPPAQRLPDQHRDQLRHGVRRRHLRVPHGLRGHLGRPATAARPAHDVLGVASNFAGIPLALAFIFTIGRTGLVTAFLDGLGINPYDSGFTIYSKLGLEIVYLYFQLPLMILIIAPAIDGLKHEWREASENMGATPAPVLALRRVADPDAFAARLDDPAVR